MIVAEAYGWALVALLLNRICDGLDGAVARLTQPTDFGGYLILSVIFCFMLLCLSVLPFHPEKAAVAAFLMLSFVGTGSSFWPMLFWMLNIVLQTLVILKRQKALRI